MATQKAFGNSYASISAQIKALEAQANALRQKEVGDVIAKAKEAIAHYGLTAEDLGFGKKPGHPFKERAAAGAKKVGKRASKKGSTKSAEKVIKFRDDQGNTWGGIGKRPRWFTAALASGKKAEDLLAKAAA